MRTRRNTPFFVAALTAVALVGGSAFTASNTMPSETHAGQGSVAVTGYTAESIDYNLDATNPDQVASVDINITGEVTEGSEAELQLSTDGTWRTCTLGTYDSTDDFHPMNCDGGNEPVADANNLSLVIAD